MNAIQYLAVSAGCLEEHYRYLPETFLDAYQEWYEPVEFAKFLLFLGVPADDLECHAENLVLPFPKAVAALQDTDRPPRDAVDRWRCARNWVQDHACMEYLRYHYPANILAPLLVQRLSS